MKTMVRLRLRLRLRLLRLRFFEGPHKEPQRIGYTPTGSRKSQWKETRETYGSYMGHKSPNELPQGPTRFPNALETTQRLRKL